MLHCKGQILQARRNGKRPGPVTRETCTESQKQSRKPIGSLISLTQASSASGKSKFEFKGAVTPAGAGCLDVQSPLKGRLESHAFEGCVHINTAITWEPELTNDSFGMRPAAPMPGVGCFATPSDRPRSFCTRGANLATYLQSRWPSTPHSAACVASGAHACRLHQNLSHGACTLLF